MTLLYRIVVLSLIWCALFIRSSDGQWNKVGTLGPQLNDTLGGSYGEGAIHFKDGIIWAGQEVITYSTDTGRSWTPLGRPVPFDYFHDFTILAISFANTDTGVISYGNGGPEDPNDVSTEDGVFRTTDRGKSWQRIFSSFNDRSFDVSYDHSPSVIHVSNNNSAIMGTSLDGGTTWNRVTLSGGYFTDFVAARDQKLYAIASLTKNTPTADVYTSADRGMTWSKAGGGLSFDSYGIGIDSCDDARLYVANEDYVARIDGYSTFYLSSDRGVSWSSVFTLPLPGLVGTIASSPHALYTPTMQSGILRSTDHGLTWKSIGGPALSQNADARDICAINDNILFAIDYAGNIWATFNSGGDSLSFPSTGHAISPDTLFDTDTSQCGIATTRTISISASGCSAVSIASQKLLGPDAQDYSISTSSNSGATILFTPSHPGLHQGTIVFTFSDGSVDSVTLRGNGEASSVLSMATSNQKTDTLGEEVDIPISLQGLTKPENIQLVLRYDTALVYLGSYDNSGAQVDVAGESWPGRSELQIANVSSNAAAAWARFNAFADSAGQSHVIFDSVQVLTSTSPCEYLAPEATIATIIPPQQCGTTILSKFMLGEPWDVTIRPNPTTGEIQIESPQSLNASLELFDALGMKRMSMPFLTQSNIPIELSLPFPTGMYYLRLHSKYGVLSSPVMIIR